MDHRYGTRRDFHKPLDIYLNDRFVGKHTVVNFSLDGLAIIFDQQYVIANVNQRFYVDIGTEQHPDKIYCQVVRRDSNLCGLLVLENEMHFYQKMKLVKLSELEYACASS